MWRKSFLYSFFRRNDRGVAMLLVMGAVAMMTTVMVEFAFRTNVQYHLALNNADRMQAYYLAESAINFSKLMIKFDKEVQKQVAKYKADVDVEPLYDMFPLSSALLRVAVETGGAPAEGDTEEAPEETPPEEVPEETADGETPPTEEESGSDMGGGLGILQGEAAQDFLSFSGDFELEVDEEDSKFDLNVFYELPKTQPDYDARKRWLMALFKFPPFDAFFEDRDDEITPETLTYRLADWTDPNDVVDELGNIERGSENEFYSDVDYVPKNGKFTSVDEIGMVPGMTPAFLAELAPYITIYNPQHLFNACLADEKLVQAFVAMYSEVNTCASPLDPEDEKDQEKLSEITTAFLGGCPQAAEMSQLLDEALGIRLGDSPSSGPGLAGKTDSEDEATPDETPAETPAEPTATGKCGPFQVQTLLTDQRSVFQLTGRGTVGETVVEIRTILNASNQDPTKWEFYYWRIN